jgi:hypothetical protein
MGLPKQTTINHNNPPRITFASISTSKYDGDQWASIKAKLRPMVSRSINPYLKNMTTADILDNLLIESNFAPIDRTAGQHFQNSAFKGLSLYLENGEVMQDTFDDKKNDTFMFQIYRAGEGTASGMSEVLKSAERVTDIVASVMDKMDKIQNAKSKSKKKSAQFKYAKYDECGGEDAAANVRDCSYYGRPPSDPCWDCENRPVWVRV